MDGEEQPAIQSRLLQPPPAARESRASAQRSVALSRSARLISFELLHPIARGLALATSLTAKYGLTYCDVIPSEGPGSKYVARATACLISV